MKKEDAVVDHVILHLPSGRVTIKPTGEEGGTLRVDSIGQIPGQLYLREVHPDGTESHHVGVPHTIVFKEKSRIEVISPGVMPPKGH